MKTSNATAERMVCPKNDTEYPGLAYISPLAELIIAKETDKYHNIIGDGDKPSYTIYNNKGEKVFLGVGTNNKNANFDLKIYNFYGNEVIYVEKKRLKFFWVQAKVWAPKGNFVGTVHEEISCVNTFLIKNNKGKSILKIRSRGICSFQYYNILKKGVKIGAFAKSWITHIKPFVGETFVISFPVDMDICDKAVLLGACFLIGCLKY